MSPSSEYICGAVYIHVARGLLFPRGHGTGIGPSQKVILMFFWVFSMIYGNLIDTKIKGIFFLCLFVFFAHIYW